MILDPSCDKHVPAEDDILPGRMIRENEKWDPDQSEAEAPAGV